MKTIDRILYAGLAGFALAFALALGLYAYRAPEREAVRVERAAAEAAAAASAGEEAEQRRIEIAAGERRMAESRRAIEREREEEREAEDAAYERRKKRCKEMGRSVFCNPDLSDAEVAKRKRSSNIKYYTQEEQQAEFDRIEREAARSRFENCPPDRVCVLVETN